MATDTIPRKVIKDTPLAEIVLRKYEMPYESDDRDLLRKLCLSIGLLQPGDSRDIIVDVLHVLLIAGKTKETITSESIRERVIKLRTDSGLPLIGVAGATRRSAAAPRR